jgi:hypothetical protein
MKRLCSMVAAVLFVIGCDNKSSLPEIKELVTITAGIYGQTGSVCDSTLTCDGVQALVNQPIGVFAELPWVGDGVSSGFAYTDTRGFFQFELADGMYFVCTGYENGGLTYTSCTDATVNGDVVSRTMIFSSGSDDWVGGTATWYP